MYEMTMDGPGRLMPTQSAPIDRTLAGSAAFNAAAGVDASFSFGDIWNSVAPVLGQVAQAAVPALLAAL